MPAYLLDTNIVIAHLLTGELDKVPYGTELVVSAITEAELLRLPGLGDKEIERISELLNRWGSIAVDSSIARRAASLGRSRKTKMLDLLIAATALENDLFLITKNTRDFKSIPNLKLKTSLKKE